MAKNIVLFSDGTGNSSAKLRKTNVWRLYQSLDVSPDCTTEQRVYYDDGVGTSRFKPLAVLGGAFGWGLKRNVIDLYTFLCRNYKAGDRVYMFGFSRGAFTIRVLSGLICNQGLVSASPAAGLRVRATRAFKRYRSERHKSGLKNLYRRAFKSQAKPATRTANAPPIHFMGLWDTVDAYGMPIDELTTVWKWFVPMAIPDQEPSPNVAQIRHALSLDDERHTFHPVLFHNPDDNPDIRQVWFCGVHCNVGGGYADDSLSLGPLYWVMREARSAGLVYKQYALVETEQARNPLGPRHDSRRGLAGFFRYRPRRLSELLDDAEHRVHIPHADIHWSVFERIRQGSDNYAPIVLPGDYRVVDDRGLFMTLEKAADAGKKLEHPSQALNRTYQQGRIWDLVCQRRGMYFSSVTAAGLLLVFPLLFAPSASCGGPPPFCSLTPLMGWLGEWVLPDFLSPWVRAYQGNPMWFAVFAGALGLCVYSGARLKRAIQNRMHDFWKPLIEQPGIPVEAPPADKTRFHARHRRRWPVTVWKHLLLPLLVLTMGFWFVASALVNGVFTSLDAAGLYCTGTDSPKLVDKPMLLPDRRQGEGFHSRDLCWASGLKLSHGKRYRITLTRAGDLWADSTLAADMEALRKPESILTRTTMGLAVLLRRHVSEDWFRPIARIGETGNDDHPLYPVADDVKQGENALVADIIARRDGELFLFVNDAVTPLKSWQYFYNNNRGTATVRVEPYPQYGGRQLVQEPFSKSEVTKHSISTGRPAAE